MATTKPIRFNDEEERTLLAHAEKYGRNFASYVKDLIIRDMESRTTINQQMDKSELKELLKELLNDQYGTASISEDPIIVDDFTSALADMGMMSE